MGKQFNHEGINNKIMGTKTVDPFVNFAKIYCKIEKKCI